MKASLIAIGLFIWAIVLSCHNENAAAVYAAAGWVVLALDGNRPNPPRSA